MRRALRSGETASRIEWRLLVAGRAALAVGFILAAALAAWSCSSSSTSTSAAIDAIAAGGATGEASPAVIAESNGGLVYEAWEYNGDRGQLIRTPNYRIYSTLEDSSLRVRLPEFMEAALAHYTSTLVDLAPPPRPLDSFVFRERDQWESFTREIMGSRAGSYLKIGRGGFSTGGRAVLYNIGAFDTLAIAAHEGWHQYTQRSFDESLPIWMEEGMATFMEGHRFIEDEPVFRPWANGERYFQLRRSYYRERLLPLGVILQTRPEEALARSNTAALEYYAQVWALMHFLNEGEDGKYRERLKLLVQDAAAGRLERRVRATFRERDLMSSSLDLRAGADVFIAYFTADLDAVDREYQEFIQSIVARRSRGRISRGESPVDDGGEN